MTARLRPLHVKDGEVAILVLVTEDEIDGIIDAANLMLDDPGSDDDHEFYAGLKRRWLRHAKDIRRSIRESST